MTIILNKNIVNYDRVDAIGITSDVHVSFVFAQESIEVEFKSSEDLQKGMKALVSAIKADAKTVDLRLLLTTNNGGMS